MKTPWKSLLVVLVIAGVATGLTFNNGTWGHVVDVWRHWSQNSAHGTEGRPDKAWLKESARRARSPWDRTIALDSDQIKAIGLATVRVRPQTDPTKLRLHGTTDYDPSTLTIARTQFD